MAQARTWGPRLRQHDDPPVPVSEGHSRPPGLRVGLEAHRLELVRHVAAHGLATPPPPPPPRYVRGAWRTPSPAPSSSPAARRASGARRPSASPPAASRCTRPRAASSRSRTSRAAAAACSPATSPPRTRCGRRSARSSRSGARSARWSTTPATASRAPSRRSRSRRSAASSRRTVFGLVRMCQLVLPGMRAQGHGRIVNVSSMGANFTFPGGGFYHATKYAVEAISDALRFEVKGFGIDVVIVQPGIIRTGFADAATDAIPTATAPEGPYGTFNAAVAGATQGAYESGPLARLGGGPETVARTIERAITARSPKIRYRVTPSARLLVGQRALMTDGMWDRFLETQFPHPAPGGDDDDD